LPVNLDAKALATWSELQLLNTLGRDGVLFSLPGKGIIQRHDERPDDYKPSFSSIAIPSVLFERWNAAV